MTPKVLLIDDEELNLLTFEAFLADDNYELCSARDGRTGIALARAVMPDLVLLDVMMPDMDGFAVCRALRADPVVGRVPIIIVTALHDTTSRLEGLKAGADDFVTKPCSRDEIRARVRTIVALNRFRAIAEQRARYEQLFTLAPVGIVVTDRIGTVVAANPQARTLLGEPDGGELVGKSIIDRLGDANRRTLRAQIDAGTAGVSCRPCQMHWGEGENARVFRLESAAIAQEESPRVMLIFHDMTAEAQASEALERVNRNLDSLVQARTRQLESANSLLLSYASFVSHDLRTPLAAIKGYLSMIQEGAVPLAESGALVDGAYRATIMMQELVQNILQLAHDEFAGEAQAAETVTAPAPIIRHIWEHIAPLFPHVGRRFQLHDLEPVAANALLIERVFYNLLTNAVKYSSQRREPVIEIGAVETEAGPAIYVRDNGVGFDQRDADKLFREFTRLTESPAEAGIGLGLSLAARLLRAHGGDIWAEGKQDEGATFYVQFRVPKEAPVAASA